MLDIGDVSVAPDEDDLREASPIMRRMGLVRLDICSVKRRNKYCIFQLRAFSRRRDRRVGTIRRNWYEKKKNLPIQKGRERERGTRQSVKLELSKPSPPV